MILYFDNIYSNFLISATQFERVLKGETIKNGP